MCKRVTSEEFFYIVFSVKKQKQKQKKKEQKPK